MNNRGLALVLWLVACGASADDLQHEARAALDAGDAVKALALADQGLAAAGDDRAATWRLEAVKLDAMASQKLGADVATGLDRLAGAGFEGQVTAQLHVALANKVTAAGDAAAAMLVLSAGDKRFPDDAGINKALDAAAKGGGADVTDALKALGYIAGDEDEAPSGDVPLTDPAANPAAAAAPPGAATELPAAPVH